MNMKSLYSTVSHRAVIFYWNRVKEINEHIAQQEAEMQKRLRKTHDADTSVPKRGYPATVYGYVRKMRTSDVVKGSQARRGWFGYFDADGDIVCWYKHLFVGDMWISDILFVVHRYRH
ncbi:MAG: hypothetical protein ACI9H6_000412 [Patiriisocius sp.]|jgi:hypothetical protein